MRTYVSYIRLPCLCHRRLSLFSPTNRVVSLIAVHRVLISSHDSLQVTIHDQFVLPNKPSLLRYNDPPYSSPSPDLSQQHHPHLAIRSRPFSPPLFYPNKPRKKAKKVSTNISAHLSGLTDNIPSPAVSLPINVAINVDQGFLKSCFGMYKTTVSY